MKEKLKEIITLKIETLKENSSKYMDIYKAVLSVIDDISNLKEFDLEKLSFIELDSEDLNRLTFSKSILSDGVYELEPSDIEYIKNFFLSIKTKVSFYIEDNLINDYSNLLDKLDNYEFNQNDIELICTLLREEKDKGNDIDIISYMKHISLEMMKFMRNDVLLKDKEENEEVSSEELEKLEVTNISSDDLINLFNKYGIDYMLFKKESRDLLEEYGVLDNIDGMLDLFINQKNIDIGRYIKAQGSQLACIFVYSNSRLVNIVLDKLSENGVNIYENFMIIIRNPSNFISRKREYLGKGKGGEFPDIESQIGHNEDFLKNVDLFSELFKEINVDDISDVYRACSTAFDLSNKHVKLALSQFKLYGIDPRCYLKRLSSFKRYPAEAIDAFIESDYFDYDTLNYLMKNPSKFELSPYDSTFYKLYMARKKGYTKEQLFSNHGFKFSNSNFLDIDNNNGSEVVEQYFPDNPKFKDFDEVVRMSDNTDISLVSTAFKFIIDDLDSRYTNYESADYCYVVGGIKISKYKVKRYLNTLLFNNFDIDSDSLLYVFTKNSILNKEEYECLKKELSSFLTLSDYRRK